MKHLARVCFTALCGCVLLLFSGALLGKENSAGARKTFKLPPAPEGVLIEQNISYLAADRAEKLDLYLPAKRNPKERSPAVVMIHGGGWIGGDKAASREFNMGTTLAKAGYVCVSVNYSLAEHNWPLNLHDCKNAVRFLRAHATQYQVDTNHIGVIGGSAGGHLALMVAYTTGIPELEPKAPYPGVSDQVQCVVDLYGITDLLTRQRPDSTGKPTGKLVNCALFATSRTENPGQWKLASPVYHVGKGTPPTLILHGKADATVDYPQAVELAAKLKEAGVEHQLVLLEGVGHTFDLQTWNRKPLPQDLRPLVGGFFDKHLKASPTKARE